MNVNNINAKPVYFNNPVNPSSLHELINTNASVSQIEQFCKQNPSLINAIDENLTPLLFAIKNKREEMALALIKMGADIDFCDKNGKTILMWTSESGMKDLVRLLLEQNVDINAVENVEQSTALHLACQNDQLEVVEILINAGADIEAKAGKLKYTPLHTAVAWGKVKTVAILLKNHANIHEKAAFQATPLHIACINNKNVQVAEALINAGADIEGMADNDATPLHVAANRGNLEIVTFLLNKKANIEAKNSAQETPLLIACANCHIEVVEKLLEAGANSEIRYKSTETLLHRVAGSKNPKSLELLSLLLTKLNVDTTTLEKHKLTSLMMLAFGPHLYNTPEEKSLRFKLLEKLIEAGADPFFLHQTNKGNFTPFSIILQNKEENVLDLFIKKQSKDLVFVEEALSSPTTNIQFLKIVAREFDYLFELSPYNECGYLSKFITGTFTDSFSLLYSKKFKRYVTDLVDGLKSLADSLDPSFLKAYDELFTNLTKVLNLVETESKVFLSGFIHTNIENIKQIKIGYNSKLEVEKLKNLEEAEKAFGREDIFEALGHFQIGIGGEKRGIKYIPTDSYKILINLQDINVFYQFGFYEGKDLQAIGINTAIENIINSLPANAAIEQKKELWSQLLKAFAKKEEFLLQIVHISSLHKTIKKRLKELQDISKTLNDLSAEASTNGEISIELEKKVYEDSKRLNKNLNAKLLKYFFYQNNRKETLKLLEENIFNGLKTDYFCFCYPETTILEKLESWELLSKALSERVKFLKNNVVSLMPTINPQIDQLVESLNELSNFSLNVIKFYSAEDKLEFDEEHKIYDKIKQINKEINAQLENSLLSSAIPELLQANKCESLSALQEKNPERFNAAALFEAHKLNLSKKRSLENPEERQ